MANLLTKPELWRDYNGNSPPIYWTGSRYEIYGSSPTQAEVVATLVSTDISPGDFLEFDYEVLGYQPAPGRSAYLNIVTGWASNVQAAIPLTTTSGSVLVEDLPAGEIVRLVFSADPGSYNADGFYLLDVIISPPAQKLEGYHVYELDRGWSFDGNYIPHYLEMNWYFGEDPFTDKTIQKVRIHGLTKGRANLNLSVAGMQTEYDSDYTEGQAIPLPRNAAHITTDYIPTTNYVDSSNWGVSLQLKFEGSNRDLSKPEPSHVLQVLALQSSPQGNGKRIN